MEQLFAHISDLLQHQLGKKHHLMQISKWEPRVFTAKKTYLGRLELFLILKLLAVHLADSKPQVTDLLNQALW